MIMIEITKNFFLLLAYLIVSLALAYILKKHSKAILWTSGLLLFCITLLLFGLGIIQIVKEGEFQVANFVTILMMMGYAGTLILVALDAIKIGRKTAHAKEEQLLTGNQRDSTLFVAPDYLPAICKTGRAPEILQKAIEAGLIIVEADHYHWTESKVLLAYMCGRIFCEDRSKLNKDANKYYWEFGKGKRFPEKDLCRLFQVEGLANARNKRNMEYSPDKSDKIDNLFEQS